MNRLPIDRQRKHFDRLYSATFSFDSKLVDKFRQYRTQLNTNLESLTLAVYYIFLFKLTNGDRDLYIVQYHDPQNDTSNNP